jgi:hypothetical protein
MGYTILTDPAAYTHTGRNTFLYAPFAPWKVTLSLLSVCRPGLVLGSAVVAEDDFLRRDRCWALFSRRVREGLLELSGERRVCTCAVRSKGRKECECGWAESVRVYWRWNGSGSGDDEEKGNGDEDGDGLIQRFYSSSSSSPSTSSTQGNLDRKHEEKEDLGTDLDLPWRIGTAGEWRLGEGFVLDIQRNGNNNNDNNNRRG